MDSQSQVEAMQQRARRRAEQTPHGGATTTLDQAVAVLKDHLERGNKARRLLADVDAMRQAQREYFSDRKQEKLIQAKELEAKVDAGLEELRRK